MLAESLPSADTPLVLRDGTKIDPKSGSVMREQRSSFVAVPTNREAVQQITRVRKSIKDLPAPPRTMNAVSAVCAYTMFGLSNEDIALALNITLDQVSNIKMSEAFSLMLEEATRTVIEQDASNVRDLISQASRNAAQRMIDLVESENEIISLNASKDVLDRAGHRPADIVEHRHKVDGELQIRVVKADTAPLAIDMDIPT